MEPVTFNYYSDSALDNAKKGIRLDFTVKNLHELLMDHKNNQSQTPPLITQAQKGPFVWIYFGNEGISSIFQPSWHPGSIGYVETSSPMHNSPLRALPPSTFDLRPFTIHYSLFPMIPIVQTSS